MLPTDEEGVYILTMITKFKNHNALRLFIDQNRERISEVIIEPQNRVDNNERATF